MVNTSHYSYQPGDARGQMSISVCVRCGGGVTALCAGEQSASRFPPPRATLATADATPSLNSVGCTEMCQQRPVPLSACPGRSGHRRRPLKLVWQTGCMAQITLRGNPINTVGELPAVGSPAPGFSLTGTDLGTVNDEQFRGKPFLLNIFPSVDTPVCASSVRTFNEHATANGLTVVCVSKDLPFAQKRFCGAEGVENVVTASAFRDGFGEDYGVTIVDGPMAGLLARAVVVVGANGDVLYSELVPEIAQEPDYEAAVAASKA